MLRDYFDAWSSTPAVLAVYHHHHNQQHEVAGGPTTSTGKPQQQPHSGILMRVEDRLHAAEKERAAKLELKKIQLREREKQLYTGRPKIDARSSALAERRENSQLHHHQCRNNSPEETHDEGKLSVVNCTAPAESEKSHLHHHQHDQEQQQSADVFGRLTQRKPSNWKQAAELELRRQKEEEEEDELRRNLLSKPRIDRRSAQLTDGQPRGVETMLKWKEERDRKRRAAEDAKFEQERGGQHAGRPQLNPTSVAIATNRRILEGTIGMDPVDDLMRRHQEHEERMRQRYDEMYGAARPDHQLQRRRRSHSTDHIGGDCLPSCSSSSASTTTTDSSSSRDRRHDVVDPQQVTERLFLDAKSRKERREQQDQANEMMSYLDQETGEILFRPNIHNNYNHSNSTRLHNNEIDGSHHDPGLWDRLSKPTSSTNCPSETTTTTTRSPSISQYSKLLAEIHRGRKQQQQQQQQEKSNENQGHDDAYSSSIFDRLSKEEIHQRKTKRAAPNSYRLRSAAGTRSGSTLTAASAAPPLKNAPLSNEQFDDDDVDDRKHSKTHYHPQLNERSKHLDPRRNETGMSRIESLLQAEKERQRNLESLQEQKRMQEEREIAMMQIHHNRQQRRHEQRMQPQRKILSGNADGGDFRGAEYDHFDNESDDDDDDKTRRRDSQQRAFVDRQAAWEAKRRQKVLAKQSQRQANETKDCTFQPTTLGPAPIFVHQQYDDTAPTHPGRFSSPSVASMVFASAPTAATASARSYSEQHRFHNYRQPQQQNQHYYFDPMTSSARPIHAASIHL